MSNNSFKYINEIYELEKKIIILNSEKEVFEELIKTIERNAVDNKTTIHNVELFAESWRKELKNREYSPKQKR